MTRYSATLARHAPHSGGGRAIILSDSMGDTEGYGESA